MLDTKVLDAVISGDKAGDTAMSEFLTRHKAIADSAEFIGLTQRCVKFLGETADNEVEGFIRTLLSAGIQTGYRCKEAEIEGREMEEMFK